MTGPAVEVTLEGSALETLADLIADRLDARQLERSCWVGPDVVARHLDVERAWVYQHAGELGVRRLGSGKQGRLRFRLDLVDEALEGATVCSAGSTSDGARSGTVEPKRRPRRARSFGTGTPLLPIRGDDRAH